MAVVVLRILAVAVLVLLVPTGPAVAQSSPWWELAPRLVPPTDERFPGRGVERGEAELPAATGLSLGRWLDGQSSLGFDVSRLRTDLGLFPPAAPLEAGPGTPYRLLDPGLQSTAISLDLKLAWPSRAEPSGAGPLQPYVSVGPAVFVAERSPISNPLATPADVTMRVGVKAGAGLAWRFDRNTAFFSEYRVTRGTDGSLLPGGGRSGAGAGVSGYDLLYGVRFKF